MALETNIPGYMLMGDADTVFGAAMHDGTYGEVVKLDLTRTADLVEIDNGQGGNLAAILTKARFEMDIEVVFPADKSAPGIGDQIDFPLAGVTGNITGNIKVLWASKDARKLSFSAAYWDSIGEVVAAALPAAP